MNQFIFRSTLFVLISWFANVGFGQETFTCGMHGEGEGLLPTSMNFNTVDFFPDETCGTPLYINCRFVFFTRDEGTTTAINGTGSFPQGTPETIEMLDRIVEISNFKLANIRDNLNCSPGQGYPKHSNVQMKVDYDYVPDSEAWDYFSRAQEMGSSYYSTAFCPQAIMSANSTWPYMRNVIDAYNQANPNTFNFFFIEDGFLIKTVETLLHDGLQPNGPYTGFSTFSGCSMLAGDYYEDRDQFVVMIDFFADWYARINFGTQYFPEFAAAGNEEIASWHIESIPGIIVHELGHSILDQFHTGGCNNIMNGNNAAGGYLNQNQLNRLHRTLMTTNHYKYISCEDITETTCNLVIDHDETFDEPISIYGDLIIREGVTLTLKSDMYLSETSSIDLEKNAKLIVDGGKLSSGCEGKWRGIRVTGGNTDFDVKFTNQAIVENARTAVSMFPPLPWPEMRDYGNGIVHADNTTFTNVGRVAELMAFQPSLNGSYFRDCIQNGGTFGITNWNCQFVEVSDCEFNDIEANSIVSEAGSFNIVGSTFHSGEHDILLANTSPIFGSEIKDNDFESAETAIRIIGTSFVENTIQNNRFNGNVYGVWMEGDNNCIIQSNDINSIHGAVSTNGGLPSKSIRENAFSNAVLGVWSVGNNGGLTFAQNCFATEYADTYIDGAIAPIISDGAAPANNCFTHEGNASSTIPDISGNPDPFTYYEPMTSTDNCLNVLFAPVNVNVVPIGSAPSTDICATAGSGGLAPPPGGEVDACNPAPTISACLAAKGWLNTAISQLTPISSPIPVSQLGASSAQRQQYKRCLDRVERKLFELYLLSGQYAQARASLGTPTTDDRKILAFSSYMYANDLTAAESYLNGAVMPSNAYADFIQTQRLNIARLRNVGTFQASPIQLQELRDIAEKEHPYAAYAKALWFALTREIMSSKLPDLKKDDGKKNFGGNLQVDAGGGSKIAVYPNPADTELVMEVSGYEHLLVRVVNMKGDVVHTRPLTDGTYKLDTSAWPAGVYFVVMIENGAVIKREKLVLSH